MYPKTEDDLREQIEIANKVKQDLFDENKKLHKKLKKLKKNLSYDEMKELRKKVKILTDTALELEEVNKMLKEENRALTKKIEYLEERINNSILTDVFPEELEDVPYLKD